MNILQKALDDVMGSLPQQALADLLDEKLAEYGVKLSPRQKRKLQAHLLAGEGDIFQFRRWAWWDRRRINLSITEEDSQKIERRWDKFLKTQLPELLQVVLDDLSVSILSRIQRRWRRESRRQRRESTRFQSRLYRRWKLGLEHLKLLLTVARELGSGINERLRGPAGLDSRYRVEVLTRLHARACQVTEEIISLLESGFADGAMARWRTLHEIAVTALFIGNHGEDLAKRYLEHQVVESRKAAHEYKRCQDRLGYDPIDDGEIESIENSYRDLIGRFGSKFGGQYGWAAEYLKVENPTFANIEHAVGIDHLRAHYRLASHNVHANPKGVFFKLGLLAESELLLAGPSNAGLADPGHCTALSLLQVSTALGLLRPNLDSLVALRIMAELESTIGQAFIDAHEQLEEDERDHKNSSAD